MDLLAWMDSLKVSIPARSKTRRKPVCFTAASVVPPGESRTDAIRGMPSYRAPGESSISIEKVNLTADRDAYRALGMLLIGYALSEQSEAHRLHLTAATGPELRQIVLWPSTPSPLDEQLDLDRRVVEVRYRPSLAKGNPNITIDEQDDEWYPRAHLPYARLGHADIEHGGLVLHNQPVCAHITGTAPSLVWLGKYLLNLSLDDSNCRLARLHNLVPPAESLAQDSAELWFVVGSPADGPLLLPHSKWGTESAVWIPVRGEM